MRPPGHDPPPGVENLPHKRIRGRYIDAFAPIPRLLPPPLALRSLVPEYMPFRETDNLAAEGCVDHLEDVDGGVVQHVLAHTLDGSAVGVGGGGLDGELDAIEGLVGEGGELDCDYGGEVFGRGGEDDEGAHGGQGLEMGIEKRSGELSKMEKE